MLRAFTFPSQIDAISMLILRIRIWLRGFIWTIFEAVSLEAVLSIFARSRNSFIMVISIIRKQNTNEVILDGSLKIHNFQTMSNKNLEILFNKISLCYWRHGISKNITFLWSTGLGGTIQYKHIQTPTTGPEKRVYSKTFALSSHFPASSRFLEISLESSGISYSHLINTVHGVFQSLTAGKIPKSCNDLWAVCLAVWRVYQQPTLCTFSVAAMT